MEKDAFLFKQGFQETCGKDPALFVVAVCSKHSLLELGCVFIPSWNSSTEPEESPFHQNWLIVSQESFGFVKQVIFLQQFRFFTICSNQKNGLPRMLINIFFSILTFRHHHTPLQPNAIERYSPSSSEARRKQDISYHFSNWAGDPCLFMKLQNLMNVITFCYFVISVLVSEVRHSKGQFLQLSDLQTVQQRHFIYGALSVLIPLYSYTKYTIHILLMSSIYVLLH